MRIAVRLARHTSRAACASATPQQANPGDAVRDPAYRIAIAADAGGMEARRLLQSRLAASSHTA
jgi:hypothetical protein